MITEIVTFKIPDDMPRDEVLRAFEESAALWRTHPKLQRKNYLYDPQAGIAGGVYTWESREDAQEAHGPAFVARIADTFGSTPEFQYFETPIVVQNESTET
jgi:hypothetical protein